NRLWACSIVGCELNSEPPKRSPLPPISWHESFSTCSRPENPTTKVSSRRRNRKIFNVWKPGSRPRRRLSAISFYRLNPDLRNSADEEFLGGVPWEQSPPPLHRHAHPKSVPGSATMNLQRTVNSVLTVCLSLGDHRKRS